jgi:hypothetical protein
VTPKSWKIAHKPPKVFHIDFQALVTAPEADMLPNSIDGADADDLMLLAASVLQSRQAGSAMYLNTIDD